MELTATGWKTREMNILKDADGNYYIECNKTCYKLDLPPGSLKENKRIKYDHKNPITDYKINGKYNLLTGALLPPE